MPRVSVIMPTCNQGAFIRRALDGLQAQKLTQWELLIVDDGSQDNTVEMIESYLVDERIRLMRFEHNRGLGAALNEGLAHARAPLIAYLPSDDVYYADHLSSLVQCLDQAPQAVLAYSGVRHHYNRSAAGRIDGYSLQMVQVMHRAGPERWLERHELVTDDLDRMFFRQLETRGEFVGTRMLTCEWVDHPHQRHKLLREPVGGINPYRQQYGIAQPLRYHTMTGNYTDEVRHYERFRNGASVPSGGLKILLVGELAYNPERILALEERGHRLYGLWMPKPHWYNTVGPLPFGHVTDIPFDNWQAACEEIRPDIIYALLNWQAVPFACQVMQQNKGIPFVWHFKEGPFICLEKGSWSQLVELYRHSDGQIYSSPEMRDWFETVVPGSVNWESSLVLDGDLPKREWFEGEFSPRLSDAVDGFHTFVPGRPIGLHPPDVAELAALDIHLHFYGDFTHGQWLEWIEKVKRLAPQHLHLHSQVDQDGWVREFSQYDAGWLHFFESTNRGEMRRANWDDLNYPARLATFAAAGVPVLQRNNSGSIVAAQNLVRELDIGLFFREKHELREQLQDRARMEQLRKNMGLHRHRFTFDYHADRLINFFEQIISRRRE